MLTTKIIAVGNSLGLLLPKEALARLKLTKGDQVFLTETPEGYELSVYDPAFAAQIGHFQQVMLEERDLVRGLAHAFKAPDQTG